MKMEGYQKIPSPPPYPPPDCLMNTSSSESNDLSQQHKNQKIHGFKKMEKNTSSRAHELSKKLGGSSKLGTDDLRQLHASVLNQIKNGLVFPLRNISSEINKYKQSTNQQTSWTENPCGQVLAEDTGKFKDPDQKPKSYVYERVQQQDEDLATNVRWIRHNPSNNNNNSSSSRDGTHQKTQSSSVYQEGQGQARCGHVPKTFPARPEQNVMRSDSPSPPLPPPPVLSNEDFIYDCQQQQQQQKQPAIPEKSEPLIIGDGVTSILKKATSSSAYNQFSNGSNPSNLNRLSRAPGIIRKSTEVLNNLTPIEKISNSRENLLACSSGNNNSKKGNIASPIATVVPRQINQWSTPAKMMDAQMEAFQAGGGAYITNGCYPSTIAKSQRCSSLSRDIPYAVNKLIYSSNGNGYQTINSPGIKNQNNSRLYQTNGNMKSYGSVNTTKLQLSMENEKTALSGPPSYKINNLSLSPRQNFSPSPEPQCSEFSGCSNENVIGAHTHKMKSNYQSNIEIYSEDRIDTKDLEAGLVCTCPLHCFKGHQQNHQGPPGTEYPTSKLNDKWHLTSGSTGCKIHAIDDWTCSKLKKQTLSETEDMNPGMNGLDNTNNLKSRPQHTGLQRSNSQMPPHKYTGSMMYLGLKNLSKNTSNNTANSIPQYSPYRCGDLKSTIVDKWKPRADVNSNSLTFSTNRLHNSKSPQHLQKMKTSLSISRDTHATLRSPLKYPASINQSMVNNNLHSHETDEANTTTNSLKHNSKIYEKKVFSTTSSPRTIPPTQGSSSSGLRASSNHHNPYETRASYGSLVNNNVFENKLRLEENNSRLLTETHSQNSIGINTSFAIVNGKLSRDQAVEADIIRPASPPACGNGIGMIRSKSNTSKSYLIHNSNLQINHRNSELSRECESCSASNRSLQSINSTPGYNMIGHTGTWKDLPKSLCTGTGHKLISCESEKDLMKKYWNSTLNCSGFGSNGSANVKSIGNNNTIGSLGLGSSQKCPRHYSHHATPSPGTFERTIEDGQLVIRPRSAVNQSENNSEAEDSDQSWLCRTSTMQKIKKFSNLEKINQPGGGSEDVSDCETNSKALRLPDDFSKIPGFTILSPNLPDWKKQLLERKNCEAIDNYLMKLANEQAEHNRYTGLPMWKVNLLRRRESQKSSPSSSANPTTLEYNGSSNTTTPGTTKSSSTPNGTSRITRHSVMMSKNWNSPSITNSPMHSTTNNNNNISGRYDDELMMGRVHQTYQPTAQQQQHSEAKFGKSTTTATTNSSIPCPVHHRKTCLYEES